MAIRTQLLLGFGALALATLVTGGVALAVLQSTVASKDAVARGFAAELSKVESVRFRSEQVVSSGWIGVGWCSIVPPTISLGFSPS